ncbi:unnamed protein product [Cuscuta campestris]|uniref:MORF/ORRM1/DAG-like MORF domain-containing protein n=1 Tax=Cuscuta campestris TaxID=132261 RepID=A0A484K641_9ASTE|nr:unnamed protein product [Cuscuta campestris]
MDLGRHRIQFLFAAVYPAVSGSVAGLETRQISSFINELSPNWSNRTSKQTLIDGCDYEHWLVVMEKPADSPSRDEIIDSYIKTLAQVVGRRAIH